MDCTLNLHNHTTDTRIVNETEVTGTHKSRVGIIKTFHLLKGRWVWLVEEVVKEGNMSEDIIIVTKINDHDIERWKGLREKKGTQMPKLF